MSYQYTNNRELHLGSMDFRVLPYGASGTYADALSVGMLDGVTFNLTGDETIIETDNTADINLGLANPTVEIGATAWKNIDVDVLYKLLGDVGDVIHVTGAKTLVNCEPLKLVAGTGVSLQYKNGNNTAVTITKAFAKDKTTELEFGIDYTTMLNVGGFTMVAPVEGSTKAKAGETIYFNYEYYPSESKKMTYSSTGVPRELHAWLVNKKLAKETNLEKTLIIEVYRLTAMTSAQVNFGNDKNKTLISMPIRMVGKPDSSRDALDDLFSWDDEQVGAV